MDKLKGDAMLYNGSDKPLIVDTDVTMLIWKDGAGDYLWYYYNNPPSDDSY
jgi:hypothetical protein